MEKVKPPSMVASIVINFTMSNRNMRTILGGNDSVRGKETHLQGEIYTYRDSERNKK